jgi:hypothetical protein
MGIIWVETTKVTIHSILTYFANVFKLHLVTAVVHHIRDVVVLCLVYKFCHSDTIPYDTDNGFLQTCLSQILRNAPLPPIEN